MNFILDFILFIYFEHVRKEREIKRIQKKMKIKNARILTLKKKSVNLKGKKMFFLFTALLKRVLITPGATQLTLMLL